MKIVESIVTQGHGALNPSYFVIHETANPGATALNHVTYWRNNPAYAVHYVGDWTGNVYHCVPDNRLCWQVGGGNAYVLGIELCHARNAADFKKVWDLGVQFSAHILKQRGWGIDRLISHDECRLRWGGTDHTDPIGYFRKYGKTWKEFKDEVAKALNAPTASPEPVKEKEPEKNSGTIYRVQVGAFRLKTNAMKMQNRLKKDGYDGFITQSGALMKVQVGAFANKSNAESLQKKLRAKGYDTVIVEAKAEKKEEKKEEKPAEKKDVPKAIWDFFKDKGLNAYAIAGIMGNLEAESALNPKNLQNVYEKSLGYTDETYTAAVDSGKYKNFIQDKAGYGLAQWTFWTRKRALQEFAKDKGASIGDLQMQLEFLWTELQAYKGVMEVLRKAETVRQASDAVLTGYEKPANMSDSVKRTRAGFGEAYYKKYA